LHRRTVDALTSELVASLAGDVVVALRVLAEFDVNLLFRYVDFRSGLILEDELAAESARNVARNIATG
jgi:hypothetical protein